jgi:putative oxidoreductase
VNKLTLVIRVLFGLIFFVFGLNGFLNFLPQQPMPEGAAGELINALLQTSYFFPLLKLVEVLCGLAILTGFFVPLALVIIAPVVIHINLFHIFLTPPIGLGLILLAMNIYLGWAYRKSFSEVLKMKTAL